MQTTARWIVAISVFWAPAIALAQRAEQAANQPGASAAPGSATLAGRILYDGPPPQPAKISFGAASATPDGAGRMVVVNDFDLYRNRGLIDESLIVGPDGGIANVIVWVRTTSIPVPPFRGRRPAETIRIKDGRYQPHVLAFSIGAPLTILNESPHGVNFKMSNCNQVLAAGGSIDLSIQRAESLPAQLTSSIHPWFNSYVFPLTHHYFTVTGSDGRFEIANLPVGEWEFAIWHERSARLNTDKSINGRFVSKVEAGRNDLGDFRVDPAVLRDSNAPMTNVATTPAAPAELNRLDPQGHSQLHRAAGGGHVAQVRELLDRGANANVEQATELGTPLQSAAAAGHGETVQALLDRGANVNARDAHGQAPLSWAAMNGHLDVVRRLLDSGASINSATAGSGWTPLHFAIARQHSDLAQLLVDRGADVMAKNSEHKSPLEMRPELPLNLRTSRARGQADSTRSDTDAAINSANLQRLASAIRGQLPPKWRAVTTPDVPNDLVLPWLRGSGAPMLVVWREGEALGRRNGAPNPPPGELPFEPIAMRISIALAPYLTAEEYQTKAAQNDERERRRLAFQRRLAGIEYAHMGPDPKPPSAFRTNAPEQTELVRQYALAWMETQPERLPTHHYQTLAMNVDFEEYVQMQNGALDEEFRRLRQAIANVLTGYAAANGK